MTRNEFSLIWRPASSQWGDEWFGAICDTLYAKLIGVSQPHMVTIVDQIVSTFVFKPKIAQVLDVAKRTAAALADHYQASENIARLKYERDEELERRGHKRIDDGDVDQTEMQEIQRHAEAAFNTDGVDLKIRERLVKARIDFLAGGGHISFEDSVCPHVTESPPRVSDRCTPQSWLDLHQRQRVVVMDIPGAEKQTETQDPIPTDDEVGF